MVLLPDNTSSDIIDLHAHTTESDGTLSPAELVELAVTTGLSALAVTDHDTFSGFEQALPVAKAAGLELVRGIELNSRLILETGEVRYAHLLAYFPIEDPSSEFTAWLGAERKERRDRNRKLAENLQGRGIQVDLSEVEARGKSLAGRTHFAQVLVEKGYARTFDDAFNRFIGEHAPAYVERQSPTTQESIRLVRSGGGIPVIAHPVRLSLPRETEREILSGLRTAGLLGLEVYHSDHPPELQAHYRQLAEELDLLPTGGSDFHGAVKPDIRLGTGYHGNIRVPLEFLRAMRSFVTAKMSRV